MNYTINIDEIHIEGNKFRFVVTGVFDIISSLAKPKVIMHFSNGIEDRRIPLVFATLNRNEDEGVIEITSNYVYLLDRLFWKSKNCGNDIVMYFNLLYGEYYEEKIEVNMNPALFEQDELCYICRPEGNAITFIHQPDFAKKLAQYERRYSNKVKMAVGTVYSWIVFVFSLLLLPWLVIDGLMATFGFIKYAGSVDKADASSFRKFLGHINTRLSSLSRHKISVRRASTFYRKCKCGYIRFAFNRTKKKCEVVSNRIFFISLRRTDLSGNFAFVYEKIKDDPNLEIEMYLDPKDISDMSRKEMDRFAYFCATSKVVVLDEFTPYIHYFDIRPETKVVQLWHACGAFKTFGFTRLGKPKGSPQKTRNHRNYDYVTVSTKNVKICHSEGFGIPTDNVVPTGIPRTDVFFDEAYKAKMQKCLYEQYPQLKDKKVILFAPTFRGHVRETAYYPMEKFRVDEFMDAVGDEYFLIIKHHPFVTERQPIPQGYQDRVLDLSDQTELNDLLFITDIIITDYSSLVFEASLLNIPMLFYTFDLRNYINTRDFYFDFETFVPGHFFYTQKMLQKAIVEKDFAEEKVPAFAKRFFDDFDGRSTERVVDLLYKALSE
ncbi:MAG: CDP-glycerol glycerophosphotransferase family protein [Clostridiales bacterium]|nr:CDP-glycerol glycerophosphotransferase family protein [Clostridiales bacterium]